jgi:hypothetical protein
VAPTSLYRAGYPLVELDQAQLAVTPAELAPLGYLVDPPSELTAFHAVAAPAVAGLTSDPARLRRLADVIYNYHPSPVQSPVIPGCRERGVHAIFADIEAGGFPLCGHKTIVLAALWRSLGGDVRQIRFTEDDAKAWRGAHYGIEVYSPALQKWFYYDATLNGYAVSPAGEPLSLVELNDYLARDADVTVIGNTTQFDFGPNDFLRLLRTNPQQVYAFDNRLRPQDPDRRFGALHFAYPLFSRLPSPIDRVMDAITGDAGTRYVVRAPGPAPGPHARILVSASPIV